MDDGTIEFRHHANIRSDGVSFVVVVVYSFISSITMNENVPIHQSQVDWLLSVLKGNKMIEVTHTHTHAWYSGNMFILYIISITDDSLKAACK